MSIFRSILKGYKQIFTFSGRTRRGEFFPFFIFHYIVYSGVYFLLPTLDLDSDKLFWQKVLIIVFLWLFLAISAFVRRLHDAGYSGLLFFVNLIPFGFFYFIYLLCAKSVEGPNQYGLDPNEEEDDKEKDEEDEGNES